MATRFGFMDSNKEGKCFYCSTRIAVGDRCAMDNNVKRRTCLSCANERIDAGKGQAEEKKPRLFAGVKDDWRPAVASLQEQLDELKKLLINAIGE